MEDAKTDLKKLMDGVFTPEDISLGMREMIDGFNMPEWLRQERMCPECNKPLPPESNHGFGVKLNAQHFGNFFIETLCPSCYAGFEWHFRRSCKDFDCFLGVLKNGTQGEPTPNYKMSSGENNLMESMMEKRKEKSQ